MAGGFDSFSEFHRHQFFSQDEGGISFIEHLIRYGNRIQNQGTSARTLFGDMVSAQVIKPKPFPGEEWPALTQLNKEKELIGIYLSAHPLYNYKVELKHFCNATLAEFRNLQSPGHDPP
jgi:DNA polymerase-3 subunit alpha